MKALGKKVTGILLGACICVTSFSLPNYAQSQTPELPDSIIVDGREFQMDLTAGGGKNTAMPDNQGNNLLKQSRAASYTVTGSDVRLYIDYSHGHGGDHFAAGWVQATAPTFYARAEVWANGKVIVSGPNNRNYGNIAEGCSYLAVGLVSGATPRIFYNW